MSNVLIGIIGVILFIGLALAGALFLGPRFQESTNNSRASAAVQAVSQVASAIEMFKVQEGQAPTAADGSDLVSRGYLKAMPSNPTGDHAVNITYGDDFVAMQLATNGEQVCQAINKQTHGSDTMESSPAGVSGCYSTGAGFFAYTTFGRPVTQSGPPPMGPVQ